MKFTLDGTGLLSGEHDTEELDRRIEEDRRKQLEAAQRAEEAEETCDGIEKALTPYLRDELAEEFAGRRLSADTIRQYSADFRRFKQCCAKWDLPYLPAPPAAVAVFMSEEDERGANHLARLKAAISAAHRAADLDDPCEDLLVRAIMRLARKEKNQPPADDPPQPEKD